MSERPQDPILDHNYDGIQEYDNPMPRWWLWIFYATILFAVLYWINLPGIGSGRGRIAGYEAEMERARAQYGERAQAAPMLDDAQLMAAVKDAGLLGEGKTVFENSCSPCHRADGGGVIGPNLTDDHWIHGGKPTQVLATVVNGVADKGMPTWGPQLKPRQLEAVVAYVLSLRGSHPPDPKEPQGVKEEPAAAAR